MNPIVNQFSDKNDYRYLLCYATLLRDILLHYGYTDLATCIGKEYCYYYIEDESCVEWFRKRFSVWDDLKKNQNFTLKHHQFANLTKALTHLQANLENGILSMSLVDVFFYPYDGQSYQKSHATHYVTITGISFEQKKVTLLDSINGYYNVELGFEQLEQAWCFNWDSKEFKFYCYDVIPPEQPVVHTKEDFLRVMQQNVQNMLQPNLDFTNEAALRILKKSNNFLAGLSGLDQLGNSVAKLIELGHDDIFSIFFQLTTIPEQLELHSNYLKNIAVKFDLPQFLPLAEDMFNISQTWAITKNMIVKTLFRDSDKYFQRCIERCNQIAQLERQFVNKLQETLINL
ncbi:MAG: BtrH N-terminal domain-containing protein [Halanaerobiales bacterium]|nr:BtrH N-terminal domain-containing protein [Halanaerobiales bacterium]